MPIDKFRWDEPRAWIRETNRETIAPQESCPHINDAPRFGVGGKLRDGSDLDLHAYGIITTINIRD
jgi:hypothetical protein